MFLQEILREMLPKLLTYRPTPTVAPHAAFLSKLIGLGS
jgi:hypothetical protein